jgi:hypothetical protein
MDDMNVQGWSGGLLAFPCCRRAKYYRFFFLARRKFLRQFTSRQIARTSI